MYEKRVRDWAIPAIISGLLWLGLFFANQNYGDQFWMLAVALMAFVGSAVTVAKFWEYVSEKIDERVTHRQHVLSYSSDAHLLEEARLLAAQSPELAGELAKRIGRPDLILFPTRGGRRPQIKLAGSEVTLQFALDALNRSDDIYYVAQRNYLDGTHHWDPNKDISDRQQWMQLNWILSRDGICQRYVPNQATNTAPMWLPPWTPQRVMELWLLPIDLVATLKPFVETQDETQDGD